VEAVMRLQYYPDRDSLYVQFGPGDAVQTQELAEGINLDIDESGTIIGLDIDHASRKLDLSVLANVELPKSAQRSA
jgi:uncharacterized protein YuzE